MTSLPMWTWRDLKRASEQSVAPAIEHGQWCPRPRRLMSKNFSYFLAKRYLIPKGLFMIIINLLTIVGVCLGVAVMIVVLSVMKGFENEFQRKLLGFDPHISVWDQTDGIPDPEVPTYREIGEALEKVPGIVSQSPYMAGYVMVQKGNQVQNPLMKAILPGDQQLKELKEQDMLVAGELDLEDYISATEHYPSVIVSQALADSFNDPVDGGPLRVGDVISVLSPVTARKVLDKIRDYRELPEEDRDDANAFFDDLESLTTPTELRVSGIVSTPLYQQFIIPSLFIGQELFGKDEYDQVHGLAVFVEDPYRVKEIKDRLQSNALLPLGWNPITWFEQNRPRLEAIRMERSMMSVILFIIVIVATFCVTVTIIVTTVQKRREIGVLKAVGAQTSQIVRIFVHQGQIVGLCGVLFGVGLGLLFLHQLETVRAVIGKFGADPFPQNVYGLSELPVEIIPGSILGIAIGAIIACTVAAIPPAWAVARLDAAKALRAD